MIVFSGFVGDNPSYLSYRIKNYRDHKTISINKMLIPNRADCINLSTFSNHANHNDLLKYGSSLNTSKLILVHGSTESKQCLQKALKEQISKNNKTYRVLSSFKGMIVHL
jgi:metallo-beta-lactamase family protein